MEHVYVLVCMYLYTLLYVEQVAGGMATILSGPEICVAINTLKAKVRNTSQNSIVVHLSLALKSAINVSAITSTIWRIA